MAAPDLLIGLMRALGVDDARAAALAGAILDWRDSDNLLTVPGGAEDPQYAAAKLPYGAKDRPFETLSELRQVLGMDEALYLKLRPYLTVYTGQARPDAQFAAAPVLQALGLPPDQVTQILGQRDQAQSGQTPLPGTQATTIAAQGTGTYSISSRATRADGTRVEIQAAIRIGSGGGFGQLYLPLSWRVGETD